MSPPAAPSYLDLPDLERHPHARAVLGAVLMGRVAPSHAYLLHGPAGAGKAAVARQFAAALLAEGAASPGTVAERVARDSHPDLTWVRPSGAAEMLVSDIEEPVVAAATRTPFESRRRVFVIESAEAMNDQAANRLLKTLEEPPAFVHLLLLTDRREDVLPTILSRCQQVRFDALPAAEIAAALQAGGALGGPHAPGGPDAHGGPNAQGGPDAQGEIGANGRQGAPGAPPAQAPLDPQHALACARLSLGDGALAARLASGEGAELRAAAERYVRDALAGETATRPWTAILEGARGAGASAGERVQERLAQEAELLPAKERKRHERDGVDARRRAERRARTRALELSLRVCELWLRDVLCMAEGAGELVHAVDRVPELEHDATTLSGAQLARALHEVCATRLSLAANVSEELALEALAYRLQALTAAAP